MVRSKKTTNKCWQGCAGREPSFTAMGLQDDADTIEISVGNSQTAKSRPMTV